MTLRTFVVGLLAVLTVSCHRPPTQPLNDLVYPAIRGIRRVATSMEQRPSTHNRHPAQKSSGAYDNGD